jgi:hypothetical protein
LSLNPQFAGKPVEITVKFTPTVKIAAGAKVSVSLPGFGSKDAADSLLVVSDPPDTIETTTWNSSLRVLTATVVRELEPGTSVFFSVPISGILLPSIGLQRSHEPITLEAVIGDKLVQPFPIRERPVIGYFESSSLFFQESAAPGAASLMTLTFAPGMLIKEGEIVKVHLASFKRAYDGIVLLECPLSSPCPRAYWDNTTSILHLNATSDIPALQRVVVTVPVASGILLPINGIVANQTTLMLSTNASAGPVNPTPIQVSQQVGLLIDVPHVSFSPPVAEQTASITIDLRLATRLVEFDTLVLHLPEFTGADFAGMAVLGASGAKVLATWTYLCPRETLSIVVKKGESFAAGERLRFIIPSSHGLALPKRGVSSSKILLFTLMKQESQAQVEASFDAIGAVNETEVTFGQPAYAGRSALVKVAFKHQMDLSFLDRIELRLLDFFYVGSDPSSVEITGGNMQDFSAVGSVLDGVTSVVLFVKRPLSAGQHVTLHLSGMVLPLSGVSARNPTLMLSFAAKTGTIIAAPPGMIEAVGSFTNTPSISFDPTFAGKPTQVTLSFVASMALWVDDVVEILLPGFSRQDGDGMFGRDTSLVKSRNAGAESTVVNSGSWNATSQALTLTVTSNIAAGTSVDIELLIGAGITLPFQGVQANDTNFTIKAEAVDGRVHATVVSRVQGVGSFKSSTRAVFQRDSESSPAQMDFAFTAEMPMSAGEVVTFTLPGFFSVYKDNKPFSVMSYPQGLFSTGSWSEPSLSLTVDKLIAPRTPVQVTVPATGGVRLNVHGVRTNQETLTISTNAAAGPVPPTSIVSSQPVGSFTNTSMLRFGTVSSPAKAGAASLISISFNASMKILQGSVVRLDLPGFTCEECMLCEECNEVTDMKALPNTSFVSAFWYDEPPHLKMTAAEDIAIEQDVVVLIESTAGIKLPVEGVRINQPTLTISTDNLEGPVNATSIATVSPVGGFFGDSLSFSPPKASADALVTLILQTHMELEVNDTMVLHLPEFSLVQAPEVTWNIVSTVPSNKTAFENVSKPENFTRWRNASKLVFDPEPRCEIFMEPVQEIVMVSSEEEVLVPSTAIKNYSIGTTGRWHSSAMTLTMDVPASLPALTVNLTTVITLEVRGLALPQYGIEQNQLSLMISFRSLSGPTPPTSITTCPPVGAFRVKTISFADGIAGEASPITVELRPTMKILIGETVTVRLLGFEGEDNMVAPTNAMSNVGLVEWQKATSDMVLYFSDEALAESSFTVQIPSALGIKIPVMGVRTNQESITISSDAAAGPVLPTICITRPVGTFLNTTRLRFNPAKAGGVTSLIISFTALMPFFINDGVEVFVPAFTGPVAQASFVTTVSLAGVAVSGEWVPEKKSVMLRFLTAIPSRTAITITVPTSVGIRLPTEGVPVAHKLSIRAEAVEGNVKKQPISTVQPVGSFFLGTRIGFSPPQVEVPTALSLSFIPVMPILLGETVTFALPNFGGPSEFAGTTGDWHFLWQGVVSMIFPTNTSVFNATSNRTNWIMTNVTRDVAVQQLTLTAMRSIQLGNISLAHISSSVGITLPFNGIPANWSQLTISTTAAAGPVPPTSLAFTPPVGSLLNSPSLSWDNARADSVTGLSLSLSRSMWLRENETITVSLPGFSGPNFRNLDVPSTVAGLFHRASWTNTTATLIFTLRRDISVASPLVLSVSRIPGVKLPFIGVRTNQADVRISTNAVEGPVLPTSVARVQPVGSFEDTTELLIPDPLAGELNLMTLQFTARMRLTPGDTVTIGLPGNT